MAQPVPTVVYTTTHAVAGTMLLTERMQDSLSSSMTEYVELTDASIYRIAQPDHPSFPTPKIATTKNAIELLALEVDETATMARSLAKKQPRVGQNMLVITTGIEIQGLGYLGSPGQSPAQILGGDNGAFFAVTDATLAFTDSQRLKVTTKVALIARSKVTNLALI